MVIQRSWKILSDAGSTSASSTEANRSPSGLHSSSDDSNCSNQTTHSMVTSASVTSPNATTKLPEAPSTSANTEASIKYVTTPQMAEATLQRLRQRLAANAVSTSGVNSESAMHSLELLRISVQSSFDKEVDSVIKRFLENYFKPAFHNIKEHLGQNAVTDDMLQKMSCALLENSKAQYNTFRVKSHTQTIVADNSSLRLAIKRPAVKPSNTNEFTKKLLPFSGALPMQQQSLHTKPTNISVTTQQPILLQQKAPITLATPVRRQIFWNTAHISTTTKFVLDVQANQAFGYRIDGKERLASKHPELIRYLPDNEDRDWLIMQNIISQQNRNSRFLFLIYDEVCRLHQTYEIYRSNPNVDLSVMHKFTVPEFMIQKMKLFFVDLNIKSRGLITNSFSVGVVHGNSHLRNALLQGVQSVTTSTTTTGVNSTGGAEISTSGGNDNMEIDDGQVAKTSNKPSSALSSSHATLTALLNNPQQHCPINPHATAVAGTDILTPFAALKLRK